MTTLSEPRIYPNTLFGERGRSRIVVGADHKSRLSIIQRELQASLISDFKDVHILSSETNFEKIKENFDGVCNVAISRHAGVDAFETVISKILRERERV
jgi:hypothetical protein